MYKRVRDQIADLQKKNGSLSFCVSYSGGADSGALLYIFKKLFEEGIIIEPAAVYFNHNLRDEESSAEDRFVSKTCAEYNIRLIKFDLDVKEYSQTKRMSIETAARELRYRHYSEIESEFDYIVQGHHSDDNAETVFFNIIRGSGTEGACGIRKIRNKYIRPLLDFTKEDIIAFVKEKAIDFVSDSSNTDCVHSRNRIRNMIFPLIEKELNPKARNNINNFSGTISEITDFADQYTSLVFDKISSVCKGLCVIDKKKYTENHNAIRKALLHKAFKAAGSIYNPDREKTIYINEKISEEKDFVFNTEKFSVATSSNNIIVLLKKLFYNPAKISVSPDRTKSSIGIYYDQNNIKGSLLTDRVKTGDVFTPFGRKNDQKVTKVLSDKKIPKILRKHLLCLRDDEKIIFIQGAGISDLVKTGDDTNRISRIRVSNDIINVLK